LKLYFGDMKNPNPTCETCGKPIRGRSDKKFCNDYCRNSHNNSINSETTALMRSVNNQLRKNRRILIDLIPGGADLAKFPKGKLVLLGFNFQYFTHQYTTKKGGVYHFCYEYGYLQLEGEWLLLVKKTTELQ
jgi:predicted nucleic acid-binding Zn ribbon protein